MTMCCGLVAMSCGGSSSAPGVDAAVVVADADRADARVPSSTICYIELDCDNMYIPDEPKLPCILRVEDRLGVIHYEGIAGVERRGRSSQAFPKLQYAVELRLSEVGELENPADLLGMGREADWVLNGAYIDRSLFRNKLLFELFQSFGGTDRYAPESAYCELQIDGESKGIYLLTERVKRDAARIPLPADLGDGSSFIIKQGDGRGFRDVGTANGQWRLIYPNDDRATPAQIAGVSTWLSAWDDVVNGVDTTTDLFSLVDLDSAVDYVLLEEFAKNNDAYFLSMHVWKAAGGRLHFTPWDLDLSFGQPDYNNSESPEGWIQYRPALITAMAQKPAFQTRVGARWRELRTGVLTNEAILARIDSYLEAITAEVPGNFDVWPIGSIQFLNDTLYPVASHAEEVGLVKTWIGLRLAWMDENVDGY